MFWDKFVTLCAQDRTSPSAVCARLGFSGATATHWKKGVNPSATSLRRVADYFGVTTEYLVSDWGNIENKSHHSVRIPIYTKVDAGIPFESNTDIEDYEEIPRIMASTGDFFALRVCEDSMEPRIANGDIVIVRRQQDCKSNDIGIVSIDSEEATCKKVKKLHNGMMLISTNPKYDPVFFTNREIIELPVSILGKVVELRSKF